MQIRHSVQYEVPVDDNRGTRTRTWTPVDDDRGGHDETTRRADPLWKTVKIAHSLYGRQAPKVWIFSVVQPCVMM